MFDVETLPNKAPHCNMYFLLVYKHKNFNTTIITAFCYTKKYLKYLHPPSCVICILIVPIPSEYALNIVNWCQL